MEEEGGVVVREEGEKWWKRENERMGVGKGGKVS